MSATMKALAERRSPEREMIPRTLLWAMLALALSALVITSFAVLTDRPERIPVESPDRALTACEEPFVDGNVVPIVLRADPTGAG